MLFVSIVLSGAHAFPPVEGNIAAAFAEGDRERATTLVLRGYGPEILSYLSTLHRSEDDCDEVFSLFSEAIWRSADSFEGRSSVRTWAYAVARKVSQRYRRDESRRHRRFRPFAEHPGLAAVAASVRTETLSFLRTERRSRLAEIRDALSPDDRELLVLRVDRKLEWRDLALVQVDEDEPVTEDDLRRRAAKLRKRFQILKARLRAVARSEGLIEGGGGGRGLP